jgi:hypothetical protein
MHEEKFSNREKLRWLAFDNHGIVTTSQAAALGIPAVELRKLAVRGALRRVGFGAWLIDESVLAFHELAHVNPRTIKVATNRRARTKLPATIELFDNHDADDIEINDGLAMMPITQALLACRGRVMRERLAEGARTAVARDLIDESNAALVLDQIMESTA